MASDALCEINVGPGGKQPVIKDTVFNGTIQKMVDNNGIPIGMKAILEEMGVNTTSMNAAELRKTLREFPDFKQQTTILENDYIHSRGHLCIFFPKFHWNSTQ